jgi:hypothetical protein
LNILPVASTQKLKQVVNTLTGEVYLSAYHLAGIVPVAGQPLDFNFPWHDSMMPINIDYLAVERSVVECAYAGCETIWIICNDDMQPLIKHRLGEYIQDPVWVSRNYLVDRKGYQKPISIHYVPIHPRDRNKRDCLGWSVLYGAWTADRISSALSKWLRPDKYYVSFPYGVYDPEILRDFRKDISSKKNTFLYYNDQTVRNGKYLGFTFGREEYQLLSKEVKEKSTGIRNSDGTRLSIEERFSYRKFSIEEIFSSLEEKDVFGISLKEHYDINSWDKYCLYIKGCANKPSRPSSGILKYKEWNGIGIDD